jgi:hypothetical protein
MSNTWSKEDRLHYESSEVMQELEKRVLETINRVDILQGKIAALDTNEIREQTVAVKELSKAMGEAGLKTDTAQDHIADDESAEDALVEDDGDYLLQEEVVDDLRNLASAAIEDGNIKLAYKIERTIDEILEQEVTCV